MEFNLHTHFPTELSDSWNSLLRQSITNVPFLSFEHQQIWWKTRGGGEWPLTDQLVIISGWESEKLIGLAPLFLHEHVQKRTLMLLGSKEICDYLDLIVKPENLERFIQELAGFLTSSMCPEWDEIIFHNLMDTTPTIGGLKDEAHHRGWDFALDCSKQSPFIQLPVSWDDYLLSIDKKQRHEIRRKLRRAEENADIHWYLVDEESDLDASITAFLALMAKDPEKSTFLSDQMMEHMQLVMRWAFKAGILQLSFLEIHQEKAAGYFCFNFENRILVYNSGFDPKFGEYSPGWILLADLLKWAIENHIGEFDFMRGNEDYKYRFGARDRFIKCAIINKKIS